MTFVQWLEYHARSIFFIATFLAIAGAFAVTSLPVGLFPQVAFPRVQVSLDSGDRPADQMAQLVTRPVEQALRVIPGVQEVTSGSSRGGAQISIDFGWGRDMTAATLQVDTALSHIMPSLPSGTTSVTRRMEPTVFPIIAYGLTSDKVSIPDLRDLVKFQITPLLTSIPGLAKVDLVGGADAEVQVEIDPHKLDAYGLSEADLVSALSGANVLQANGRIEDHNKLFIVISNSNMAVSEEVKNVVLRSDQHSVVRVRDVAEVKDGEVPQWVRVVEDGKNAVLFQVYEQPDGNAVQIAKAVRDKLATFNWPEGVNVANWYDQSTLVVESAGSVRDAVLIGLVLSGVVLFLFLRSWRVILVAVLIVPSTLLITVLLLQLTGQSFNIMTLGGIAAAVGLIIDDVIVMVEHIARRAGALHRPRDDIPLGKEAVLPAGQEFLRPLMGSSFATMIVFIPLAFLSGVTGAFSKTLAITMAAALLISMLLVAFVVPLLARALINFQTWHDPAADRSGWYVNTHGRILDLLFRHRWLLLVIFAPIILAGYLAYQNVPTGFMPKADEGGFIIDYKTLPGTSLAESDRQIKQIEQILRDTPEVLTFSRRTGMGLGGTDLEEPNVGDFFVRLKPQPRRPIDEIMPEVLLQIQKQVPAVDCDLAQLMEDLIGDLTAVPQPIEIRLFSDDAAKLIPTAKKVGSTIQSIPGVTEMDNGIVLAGDALNIVIDPVKASLEGMTTQDISSQMNDYLSGNVATQLTQPLKQIGVRVWLSPSLRRRDEDVAKLPIRASDGHIFPLQRVATLGSEAGQPEVHRANLQQMIAVTARIEKRDLGSTISDVQKVLDEPGALPQGVRYELGGLYKQQQIAFAGLAKVFAAALVAEVILLAFLYERFWLPLIIISTSLLSTTAVFMILWATGVELNITALMGMTMIIGISTEMAIFYVSEYTELARHMPALQALREASRNRLRPITMTTLAAVFTLLPLALALGPGSGIQQPLALSIIAGLILQFPTVLLAMPVLISFTLPRERRGAGAEEAHTHRV
ncbi:MAG TPA: efflux RND transporter permease subunit [Xanthobacteraceae bacterium]|nr:efflux RND transporter permease subunit [Xanthobacteraceae bacterium]